MQIERLGEGKRRVTLAAGEVIDLASAQELAAFHGRDPREIAALLRPVARYNDLDLYAVVDAAPFARSYRIKDGRLIEKATPPRVEHRDAFNINER